MAGWERMRQEAMVQRELEMGTRQDEGSRQHESLSPDQLEAERQQGTISFSKIIQRQEQIPVFLLQIHFQGYLGRCSNHRVQRQAGSMNRDDQNVHKALP